MNCRSCPCAEIRSLKPFDELQSTRFRSYDEPESESLDKFFATCKNLQVICTCGYSLRREVGECGRLSLTGEQERRRRQEKGMTSPVPRDGNPSDSKGGTCPPDRRIAGQANNHKELLTKAGERQDELVVRASAIKSPCDTIRTGTPVTYNAVASVCASVDPGLW